MPVQISDVRAAIAAAAEMAIPAEQSRRVGIELEEHPENADERLRLLRQSLSECPDTAILDGGTPVIEGLPGHPSSISRTAAWAASIAAVRGPDETLDRLVGFAKGGEFEVNSSVIVGGASPERQLMLAADVEISPWSVALAQPRWNSRISSLESVMPFVLGAGAASLWSRGLSVPFRFERIAPKIAGPVPQITDWYERHIEPALNLTALPMIGPAYPILYFLVPARACPMSLLWHLKFPCMPRPSRTISQPQFDELQALYAQYRAMERRLSAEEKLSFDVPFRRLHGSLIQRNFADSAIEMRIALETAFAPNDNRGDYTYRVALHAARYLEADPKKREAIREDAKKAYRSLSAAVHGGRLAMSDKDLALSAKAGDLVARSLRLRLERNELPDWNAIEIS